MKLLSGIVLVLSAVWVALGMTPLIAESPHLKNQTLVTRAKAFSPSVTQWFIDTIDSTDDVGQHVSIAFDLENDTASISYYDATNADLGMAKFVGSGGNC